MISNSIRTPPLDRHGDFDRAGGGRYRGDTCKLLSRGIFAFFGEHRGGEGLRDVHDEDICCPISDDDYGNARIRIAKREVDDHSSHV
jgi:hypothetical protein